MPRNKTINTEWLLDNVKYAHRFDQYIARRQYIAPGLIALYVNISVK